MDQFIQQLGMPESEGSFTMHPVAAFEKMKDRRSSDEIFPYWKFLQASFVRQAGLVKFKMTSSAVTLQAYSAEPFPALDEFCEGLPNNDPLLEPLRSAALSLRSDTAATGYWFQDGPEGPNGPLDLRVLDNGEYLDHAAALVAPRDSRCAGYYRLVLSHTWREPGGMLARTMANLRRRSRVAKSFARRAKFFPIPLMEGTMALQRPVVDDMVPSKAFDRDGLFLTPGYSNLPAILAHKSCPENLAGRFLAEPLVALRLESVVGVRNGKTELLRQARAELPACGIQLLLLGLDARGTVTEIPSSKHIADRFRDTKSQVELPQSNIELSMSFYKGRYAKRESGRAFLTQETIFIPQWAEGHGWICIIDRGVVLGVVEADIGVDGAMAVRGRGSLKVDLSGGNIVQDEEWSRFLAETRKIVRETLAIGIPYISEKANSYKFLSGQLKKGAWSGEGVARKRF